MNRPTDSRWLAWTAAVWLLAFGIIIGDTLHRPLKHTTMPTYRTAALHWWAGEDPYTYRDHDGFLYLPQAAVIFSPFACLPFYAGEVLWRMATFGLYAWAIVRLARTWLDPGHDGRALLLLSLLAIPASLASLRNAQFDLPLAALIVLAGSEVARSRWTAAAVFLSVAIAMKPLAAVPLLLYGALYARPMVPRLSIGLAVVVLFPFLNGNPAFVAHEYVRCYETLRWATDANEPRYSDLSALLSHVGINLPDLVEMIVRAIFALVYLGLGFLAVRRLEPARAAWTIAALAADYLMLFNPRTETCSYVVLAPWTAGLALLALASGAHRALGWFLVFASIGFACDAFPYIHGLTDRWLKPLLAVAFLPILVRFALGKIVLAPRANAAPA